MNKTIKVEYEVFKEDNMAVLSIVDKKSVLNMFRDKEAEEIYKLLTEDGQSLEHFLQETKTKVINRFAQELIKRLEDSSYWTESTFDEDGWSNDDSVEAIYLYDVILIIKQLVNESKPFGNSELVNDVCKWKLEETTGIVWHCDDECTTYNLPYSQNLKMMLSEFECKCPHCGKKIEVVEDEDCI